MKWSERGKKKKGRKGDDVERSRKRTAGRSKWMQWMEERKADGGKEND